MIHNDINEEQKQLSGILLLMLQDSEANTNETIQKIEALNTGVAA